MVDWSRGRHEVSLFNSYYSSPWVALLTFDLYLIKQNARQRYHVTSFGSLVWLDFGLNPGFRDHWWTLLCQWANNIYIYIYIYISSWWVRKALLFSVRGVRSSISCYPLTYWTRCWTVLTCCLSFLNNLSIRTPMPFSYNVTIACFMKEKKSFLHLLRKPLHIFWYCYHIYQALRSGRIWHKVNL